MIELDRFPKKFNNDLIGWFAIAFSQEVPVGKIRSCFFSGKRYFLKRTSDNQLIFSDETKTILEQNHIIYLWHHPENVAPHWQLPRLDETNWSPFRYHQFNAQTHPQDIYENSIDFWHFPIVHAFSDRSLVSPPSFENHTMSVKHLIHRANPFSFSKQKIAANFKVELHGLGCAYTHIHVPVFNMHVRMFALTTPIEADLVTIRLATSIAISNENWLMKLIKPFIHRIIMRNITKDFCQDVFIWENKYYRAKPLLVKGEENIVQFRQWCQQFYA